MASLLNSMGGVGSVGPIKIGVSQKKAQVAWVEILAWVAWVEILAWD